jgi:hypothetical protein
MKLSASAIAGYAKNAGVSGGNIAIATAIALAESGGETTATNHNSNGSTDYGLWQINSVHSDVLSGHDWADPAQNAGMMFAVSSGGQNWNPWSVYKSGAYMTHMAESQSATPDTNAQQANLGGTLDSIQEFANMIRNPHLWERIGMMFGGSFLLYLAFKKSLNPAVRAIQKVTP